MAKIKAFERNEKKKVATRERVKYKKQLASEKAAYKAQEIPDKSFRILSLLMGGILVTIVVALMTFGVAKITKDPNEDVISKEQNVVEVADISNEQLARALTDQVGNYVKEYYQELQDNNGQTIKLSELEEKTIKNDMMAQIIKLLEGTDLMSLTEQEKNELISQVKESVVNNVLKNTSLSQYLTEEDYMNISQAISNIADTGLTSQINSIKTQIDTDKQAQSKVDSGQNTQINSLEKSVSSLNNDAKSANANLNNQIKSSKSDLESKIKDLKSSTGASADDMKKELTKLISDTKDLTETSKTELTKYINDYKVKNESDMEALKTEILDRINSATSTKAFSEAIAWDDSGKATVTITDSNIKQSSTINIVYTCSESGYTVKYTQNSGSLIIELRKAFDTTGCPDTLTGKMFIDNSAQ